MIKNPYGNAVLAAAYIVGIVNVLGLFVDNPAVEGTLYMPMMMLSLLVLSAAVMGFLFFWMPVALYLDNKKHEALAFFGKTVGTFTVFALIFVVIVSSFLR